MKFGLLLLTHDNAYLVKHNGKWELPPRPKFDKDLLSGMVESNTISKKGYSLLPESIRRVAKISNNPTLLLGIKEIDEQADILYVVRPLEIVNFEDTKTFRLDKFYKVNNNTNSIIDVYKRKEVEKSLGLKPKKEDDGKLMYQLIPPIVLKALASVLTFGAKKYKPYGWREVEPDRYVGALYRHLEAWRAGEKIDKESNLPHLWHAITNIAFLIWFDKKS